MFLRTAAMTAGIAALCMTMPARAEDPMTLDDAFRRVAAFHPSLRLVETGLERLDAEQELAAQRPALEAGVELENALGTGAYEGVGGAELTLHLGSVLERRDKAGARIALAQGRIEALRSEQDATRLDLLAEVARRFIALSASEGLQEIATLEIAQRAQTVESARARFIAGATPESVVLTAEAALARARLAQGRATQQSHAARQYLAALWGERDPAFGIAGENLLDLPAIADLRELAQALRESPQLTSFASERRIREARLRLAQTATSPDLRWQLGIRRIEASDDVALVAGISLPLGSRQRAAPQLREARAGIAALDIEHEASELSLYATLAEAHGRYTVAQFEVQQLQAEVLPRLARAEAAAASAYRAGAASFTEWSQLQSELTATRARQLEAALDARNALIEMQRMTGRSFLATRADAAGEAP